MFDVSRLTLPVKKIKLSKMITVLLNLFVFDIIMVAIYMAFLYESSNWLLSDRTKDDTFVDKLTNRFYYSLMISSTIGPSNDFAPSSRLGKVVTICHIYLSIMFLPFLLAAIVGLDWMAITG